MARQLVAQGEWASAHYADMAACALPAEAAYQFSGLTLAAQRPHAVGRCRIWPAFGSHELHCSRHVHVRHVLDHVLGMVGCSAVSKS